MKQNRNSKASSAFTISYTLLKRKVRFFLIFFFIHSALVGHFRAEKLSLLFQDLACHLVAPGSCDLVLLGCTDGHESFKEL